MIKLQIIGHLGSDATINTVNGKSVINFNVAHSEKYKSGEETKTKTTWVQCSYWTDKTAIAPYLKKGAQVYCEGQPDTRTYDKDGKTIASISLRVTNVQLLGSKQDDVQPPVTNDAPTSYGNVADAPIVNDDLPF